MITRTDINNVIDEIYQANVDAGWYTCTKTGDRLQRNIPEMMMLMVSEISEAMEAYRKNTYDDKLPKYHGTVVELADLFIRLADLVGYMKSYGYPDMGDFDNIIYEKRLYNAQRSDHKLENRLSANGKKF